MIPSLRIASAMSKISLLISGSPPEKITNLTTVQTAKITSVREVPDDDTPVERTLSLAFRNRFDQVGEPKHQRLSF